jgi:predicted Zn-dependent protease
VSDVGQIWVRAAHIVLEGTMFVVAGIATPAAFERFEPAFSKAIQSFRPLTRAQAEEIHPNRIALYTARQGDTWQGIADAPGKARSKPRHWRS